MYTSLLPILNKQRTGRIAVERTWEGDEASGQTFDIVI